MNTVLWADVVVVLHLAYVGFVLFGYASVLLGAWRGWGWVRNPVFRYAHLAAIGWVAVEAVIGWICPLTWLEYALRHGGHPTSFVGRMVHAVLYYDLPTWVFTAVYVALAALAVLLLVWVPPRRAKRPL